MILLSKESVEADPKDHYGLTPLSIAARYQRIEVIKRLLRTGRVDINSQDSFGRTPLWYARESGNAETARLLLDCAEKRGMSACHDELPTNAVSREPGDEIVTRICDVCTFGVREHEVYYHCRICDNDDYDVCMNCYELGARCLDPEHQLIPEMHR